ncbi:TetR/AcrR family transcriptional regulator [Candidatus Mycobacterium wuenschmannii]|uniref:TetR/AcrR family transcriptional regulator n=1 Tax=Candidatus Mycobacterium wuenschmannii TaxID=3027808 RepID=A0ABY8VWN2_9MYCO|nr:TetR/AcrR family transcriptional regulator [Candidatus Mycobacterium wuenschmannii]WIM88053.1 TetR/AcrR family transcriptional regulator [Candidatus Mycobacterium wuenschmannii]
MKTVAPTKGGRGARQRILEAAAELFYRDGINATGVEKLAAASSVSKRTLYQHFPSKTAVVEEYLRGMERRVDESVIHSHEGQAPRERMLAAFDGHTAGGETFRGCPFHNAAVESAGAMPGVQDIVRTAKLGFADWLAQLAAEAGAANPRQLGGQLAVLYEGAGALATSLDDPEPWARAKRAAEVLIDHALPG